MVRLFFQRNLEVSRQPVRLLAIRPVQRQPLGGRPRLWSGEEHSTLDVHRAEPRESTAGNIPQPQPQNVVGGLDDEDEDAPTAAANEAGGEQPVAVRTPQSNVAFRTRDNFEVQILADHASTGSIIAMEFNEFGELLLARENGPLLLMIDANDDKTPDSLRIYCEDVTNIQGILPLNGEVYVTGEGPDGLGLFRLSDTNKDGQLEIAQTLVEFEGDEAGEHGPHAVALGPDGFLYVLVGNHTKIKTSVSKDGPFRYPYEGDVLPRQEDPGGHAVGVTAPGGLVLRTGTTGGDVEMVAGGLRNSYDLCFDPWGNLFTHDSDMEADEGTPWYRPTRLQHLIPGGEYGWRSGWAKWPDYYHDMLPTVVDTGRGSPTGIVSYDHFAFPAEHRHNLFACDWTEGRILEISLKNDGAGFKGTSRVFLEGKPCSPTAIALGPDGWLYFATGGRGTAGGVYRIVYTGEVPTWQQKVGTGIAAAIRHPQLESAWARQNIAQIKQEMGERWNSALPAVARTQKNKAKYRTRALDLMRLFGPTPSPELIIKLSQEDDATVRMKVVDLMSLGEKSDYETRLTEMLADADPGVRRHVCDALVRLEINVRLEDLTPMLISHDRVEAFAARRVLERLAPASWQDKVLASKNHRLFIQGGTALVIVDPRKETAGAVLARFQQLLPGYISDDDFVDMLRLVQLAIHRADLTGDDFPALADALAEEFPAGHATMNRELLKLLVRVRAESISPRYIAHLQSGLEPADRLHAALMGGMLGEVFDSQQRMQLLQIFEELLAAEGGASVDGYIQSVTRQFAAVLTEAERRHVLDNGVQLPNAVFAVLFQLPEKPDQQTLTTLKQLYGKLNSVEGEVAQQTQLGIVAVLGNSADEVSMQFLRELYAKQPQQRSFISMALSQRPAGENWPLLIQALPHLDLDAVPMVLTSLGQVDMAPQQPEPFRQTIMHGLTHPDMAGKPAVQLLKHWSGEDAGAAQQDVAQQLAAWQAWFTRRWPDHPNRPLRKRPAIPGIWATCSATSKRATGNMVRPSAVNWCIPRRSAPLATALAGGARAWAPTSPPLPSDSVPKTSSNRFCTPPRSFPISTGRRR